MEIRDLKFQLEEALYGEKSNDFTFIYNTLETIAPQLIKEIEQLEEVAHARFQLIKGYERIVDERDDEINKLKEALNFYANKENYRDNLVAGQGRLAYIRHEIDFDGGDRAREVLGICK